MIDLNELALEIANNFSSMKLLELQYRNGEQIVGQVDRVPDDPMVIYIRKRIVKTGDKSLHKINFKELRKVTITYYQNPQRIFE